MLCDAATNRLSLSATDLASFLACRHRTALEIAAASGKLKRPAYDDPRLEALFRRGLDHEVAYVARLKSGGKSHVVELGDVKDRTECIRRTIEAMSAGADLIVQAAVGDERWFGRPDVLVKTDRPSVFGPWSYEIVDTKLARETKAGAILQLSLYCHLLEAVQQVKPALFHVETPDGSTAYRVDDYAAYFRLVRSRLEEAGSIGYEALAADNYPEPVEHCDICPWTVRCKKRRRSDDHLSLVAGILRGQRRELVDRGFGTLTQLAAMPIQPIPFKPKRGAADSYERTREQARLQFEARTKSPIFELLPIVAGQGLCRLPTPSPGDVFLDLEGDPFAGPLSGPPVLRGREYLFGLVTVAADGAPVYEAVWADTHAKERTAFEQVVDTILSRQAEHPAMHVYHYAPYEPSAFKRLMGRHGTREQAIDSFLRSGTFVDLYAVVRQGLRAGIERYSIKNLETLYGYERDIKLEHARAYLQAMELAVERNAVVDLKPEVLAAVEGYNRDDCVSTLRLRDWLESLCSAVESGSLSAPGGQAVTEIPRLAPSAAEPSPALTEQEERVAALREQLFEGNDPARRLLADLLEWHRREAKAGWWEYYRMLDLTPDRMLDEPGAISGLEFRAVVRPEKRSFVHRYHYPPQEMDLRRGQTLKLTDKTTWSKVEFVDRQANTIDILVGPARAAVRPVAAFEHSRVDTKVVEDAIFAIGLDLVQGKPDPLALALLNRRPPKSWTVTALSEEVLAIQGPPGTGKTYTGSRLICELVTAGKRVGVASTSHKVIRNLLDEVSRRDSAVRMAHKCKAEDDIEAEAGPVREIATNEAAAAALESREVDVLGGTAWLWARPEFRKLVDVLFIDEAGQVSLANALAMTQAAGSLVLLGDPQQLDQPKQGSHPDGADVSVLEHILDGAQTMPAEQGMFLAATFRFGPPICAYTSEVFYEGKLHPTREKRLELQRLRGGPIDGAGLFVLDVPHEGNRNGADEEVDAIAALLARLTAPGSMWVDDEGQPHQMTPADILVVSPYNVQVSRLTHAAPDGVRCGTVDKFQGQQAPVAIYSMATSSPDEAPRGMEFLYSLNRLNVATSRAKCAAIVVASPSLYEPACKTPRQMQLANALCRYRELASRILLP